MDHPIIDPQKVPVLVAAGLGSFLSILFQRSSTKLQIFTTLAAAEVVAYYFALPLWAVLKARFSWVDVQWQGPVALTIGLLAIFVVGGVTKMAEDFYGNPWKAMGRLVVSILERFIPGKGEK